MFPDIPQCNAIKYNGNNFVICKHLKRLAEDSVLMSPTSLFLETLSLENLKILYILIKYQKRDLVWAFMDYFTL